MIDMIPIPDELEKAYLYNYLIGDYLLSSKDDWVQPCDFDRITWSEFDAPFDAINKTKENILCGAIRICNTGCEGYHLYVFKGKHKGEVWSDQRVPFGEVKKICNDVNEYIHNLKKYRESHIERYS